MAGAGGEAGLAWGFPLRFISPLSPQLQGPQRLLLGSRTLSRVDVPNLRSSQIVRPSPSPRPGKPTERLHSPGFF